MSYQDDEVDEFTYTIQHQSQLDDATQANRFKYYLSEPPQRLYERLSYVLGQLQKVTGDIALVECSAAHIRTHTFHKSQQSSVQARDRESSYYSLQLSNELIELRAVRDIYTIERDFILLCLDWKKEEEENGKGTGTTTD